MKKMTLSLVMITLAITVFAQTPQAFKYQAVVRDNAGEIIANQSVKFRISIRTGSAGGAVVYRETHPVITNGFGLANLNIGEGTPVSGTFSSIDWATPTKFLEVELDPLGGNNYVSMGTTQLISVPYALFAENTANADDADADPSNELNASVNLNGTNLEVTDAGGTIITDLTSLQDDADANPANELQSLSLSDDTLFLSQANSVFLPYDSSLWQTNAGAVFYNDGNVGIGTTNPTAKLHVAGNLRMADGNQETGRVMVSDSIGTASWMDATAIDDGDWNTNDNFVFNVNDSIGIGTSNPSMKLDVDFGDIIVQGPESFDAIGERASLYLGTAHSYIRSEYGYGLKIGTYAASDAIAIKETSANVGIGTNLTDKSKMGLFTNNKDGSKSLPISHRLTIGHTLDNKLLRLIGPLGNFGHGARLNFGDGDYAYIEEDEDDYLTIHANRVAFTGGLSGRTQLDVSGNISISNTGGSIFIGEGAGYFDDFIDSRNIGIGTNALYNNTGDPWGNDNIAIGTMAMYTNYVGEYNVAIGEAALHFNTSGHYNTAIGNYALFNNTYGEMNVAVGDSALFSCTNDYYNTAIGESAGFSCNGYANVFIGYEAGYFVTGSGTLYIGVGRWQLPLIWGDFSDERIVIAGNSTHNTNDRTFFSNGSAGGTTAWYNDSDKRLKKNIRTIPSSLDKVLQLRGVNYEWENTERHPEGLQMGFIAQETQKVIPEVVDENNGHYAMQYAPITALLVEAVKEQQKMIEYLEKENQEFKKRIEKLEKKY